MKIEWVRNCVNVRAADKLDSRGSPGPWLSSHEPTRSDRRERPRNARPHHVCRARAVDAEPSALARCVSEAERFTQTIIDGGSKLAS